MLSGDTVEAAQMTLGLVPEILDAIDVILILREQFGVVDAEMFEARDIEHVVGAEGVGIDDRIGHDLALEDGPEGAAFDIRDDSGIDLAAAF